MARQHGATRLYIDQNLDPGRKVDLGSDQSRYLTSVLRARAGEELLLFNGRDGEWLGRIETIKSRTATIVLEKNLRAQPEPADCPWLAYAGAKRGAAEMMVQKATELGVGQILPINTARSRPGKPNLERLETIAIGAAEQSGRVTVPDIAAEQTYDDFLATWSRQENAGRILLMADETGAGRPLAEIVDGVAAYCLFVGPEGGFTKLELDAAAQNSNLIKVDLGPRILRAETAAIAGLAILQSLGGNWRLSRDRT